MGGQVAIWPGGRVAQVLGRSGGFLAQKKGCARCSVAQMLGCFVCSDAQVAMASLLQVPSNYRVAGACIILSHTSQRLSQILSFPPQFVNGPSMLSLSPALYGRLEMLSG